MPHRTVSVPSSQPWFTERNPWPWTNAHNKKTVTVGNPQHVLTGSARRLGFNADVSVSLAGNATGAASGNFPATLGAVLNLSAAQIASSPAFNRRGAFD